jgi:hypothetical protein
VFAGRLLTEIENNIAAAATAGPALITTHLGSPLVAAPGAQAAR